MKVYSVELTTEVEVQAETAEEARAKAIAEMPNVYNWQAGFALEIEDIGDQE